jgi:hypothetical protein
MKMKTLAILAMPTALIASTPALAVEPNSVSAISNGGIVLAIVLGALFLPVIIANVRRHRSCMAIVILCCLSLLGALLGALGGPLLFIPITFVCFLTWFTSLIWSCTGNVYPPRVQQQLPTTDPRWSNLHSS